MTGYLGLPEATREAVNAGGWLHTGDLATLDDRGYLRITGRLKEIINRGARKIAPGEIESLLNSHPAVAQAAVIGVPDQRLGEEIAAFVRLAPDATVTEHELARLCAEQLAPFKRPRHWIFLDQMPLTRSGKVHKPALRDIFHARRAETSERSGYSSTGAGRPDRTPPQRAQRRSGLSPTLALSRRRHWLSGAAMRSTRGAVRRVMAEECRVGNRRRRRALVGCGYAGWSSCAVRSRLASVWSRFQAMVAFVLHERPELPVGEPVADELGARGDRRRACALVDERDLAEVVAARQRRALPAADRDRRLARLDHEERRAARALLGDRLARGEAAFLEQRGDAFDVARAHVGEERHPLDHLDRPARSRRRGRPRRRPGPRHRAALEQVELPARERPLDVARRSVHLLALRRRAR